MQNITCFPRQQTDAVRPIYPRSHIRIRPHIYSKFKFNDFSGAYYSLFEVSATAQCHTYI